MLQNLNNLKNTAQSQGQSMIEYMLLLTVVIVIALVGFSQYMPRVHKASNVYMDRAARGIMDKPNPCGDGSCNAPYENTNNCCIDCPSCYILP